MVKVGTFEEYAPENYEFRDYYQVSSNPEKVFIEALVCFHVNVLFTGLLSMYVKVQVMCEQLIIIALIVLNWTCCCLIQRCY